MSFAAHPQYQPVAAPYKPYGEVTHPTERRFSPYDDNGGTILSISSHGFAIVASDTRQSQGYNIQTRYQPRIHQLTDSVAVAIQGFMADGNALLKNLKMRLDWYYHTHQKYPDLAAIARLVQTMLYGKRFFPYYAYVILGGIDRDGTGAVYGFDPVGSYERESCRAAGSAQSLIQPFLDNQINGKNLVDDPNDTDPNTPKFVPYGARSNLPLEKVTALVVDAFTGATERHIEVGDGLEMLIIKAPSEPGGKVTMEFQRRPLKRD